MYQTIKQKLIVNVVLVLTSFLIIGVASIFLTSRMAEQSKVLVNTIETNRATLAMIQALSQSDIVVTTSFQDELMYQADVLRSSGQVLAEASTEMVELSRKAIDKDAVESLTLMADLSRKLASAFSVGANIMEKEQPVAVLQKWALDEYLDIANQLKKQFALELERMAVSVPAAASSVEDAKSSVTVTSVVMILVAAVLSGGLMLLLATSLSKRVAVLQQSMQSLSEGDLNVIVDSSGLDEIAGIAHSLETVVSQMRSLVAAVKASMSDVSRDGASLNQIVTENSEISAGLENEMTMLSTAMQEMSLTVGDVAKNAEGASDNARLANDQARAGEEKVVEMSSEMETLNERVIETSGQVTTLSKSADSISTILDVIKGIAEQTNLLALNAAIEAARAGEQGRGFAVVADEVRTLATRTQESTNEIFSVITSLQSDTSKTADTMESVSQLAGSVNSNAQETRAALKEIVGSIEQISFMNSQIATAAEEQSATAMEINGNVGRVVELSSSQNAKTQKAGNIAESLNHSSELVSKKLDVFKT